MQDGDINSPAYSYFLNIYIDKVHGKIQKIIIMKVVNSDRERECIDLMCSALEIYVYHGKCLVIISYYQVLCVIINPMKHMYGRLNPILIPNDITI